MQRAWNEHINSNKYLCERGRLSAQDTPPFEITASHKDITKEDAVQAFMALRNSAKENGLQDMSLDDINAEINAVRNDDSE